MSVLRTLASGTLLTHEIEIKRSRFITTLARTDTPEEARAAIDAGAWAVVVGTAITHPTSITSWFKAALEA